LVRKEEKKWSDGNSKNPLLQYSNTPNSFLKGGQNEKIQSVYFGCYVVIGSYRFLGAGYRCGK
jgi:hypothetical protein